MSWYHEFKPYVSVAERRRNAAKTLGKLAKGGKAIQPVVIEGRTIASTFWGKSWCEHLESYMDYANRLPRGRTYVRNGSVVHLGIQPGEIEARVVGSELYSIRISVTPLTKTSWQALCQRCTGAIGSLVELLQGRFSNQVMGHLIDKKQGLFPSPREIKMQCSCPDSASLCKHLAAVLYGVGARLDAKPNLLFTLRSVDQEELISKAATGASIQSSAVGATEELAESDLAGVFGIELESTATEAAKTSSANKPAIATKSTKAAGGAKASAPPQVSTKKKRPSAKKAAPKKSKPRNKRG